jgi:thiol-disulfide isomerase/thioredoxin
MSRQVSFNMEGSGDSSGLMSKMKGSFNTKTIMYIVAAILFITISVFFYYQYIKPIMKPSYASNREQMPHDSSSSSSKDAELMLFFVDWCPHCKTAKPDWEELKSEYENKTINGYRIIFTEVNCTNETPEVEKMVEKYKIEGYPTIKLLKDGQVIEYDAKPTKDTLEQFLNTVL